MKDGPQNWIFPTVEMKDDVLLENIMSIVSRVPSKDDEDGAFRVERETQFFTRDANFCCSLFFYSRGDIKRPKKKERKKEKEEEEEEEEEDDDDDDEVKEKEEEEEEEEKW
uniref:Uncharacterized protein n=1 Tax=Vespula pensylvanica TaxID=30213 RepID=A0A834NT21_VESPE|nr:hypothetical protein H0235_011750 [Vespula pensylvanica]